MRVYVLTEAEAKDFLPQRDALVCKSTFVLCLWERREFSSVIIKQKIKVDKPPIENLYNFLSYYIFGLADPSHFSNFPPSVSCGKMVISCSVVKHRLISFHFFIFIISCHSFLFISIHLISCDFILTHFNSLLLTSFHVVPFLFISFSQLQFFSIHCLSLHFL